MVDRSKLLIVALALIASPSLAAPNPRAVFAAHDPEGRLPNTQIRKLGSLHVHQSTYSIYYLNFVNPVSLHGQQRVAIIKNGSQFVGAYQCTLGPQDAKLKIGKDRLTVIAEGHASVIRFDARGPSRNRFFCGEGSGWENSI